MVVANLYFWREGSFYSEEEDGLATSSSRPSGDRFRDHPLRLTASGRPPGSIFADAQIEGVLIPPPKKKSHPCGRLFLFGRGGIRTPGPLQVFCFQDRRIRPLCHSSKICHTLYNFTKFISRSIMRNLDLPIPSRNIPIVQN
jgi:hypothetical protein